MFKLLSIVSLAIVAGRVSAIPVWGQCKYLPENHGTSQAHLRKAVVLAGREAYVCIITIIVETLLTFSVVLGNVCVLYRDRSTSPSHICDAIGDAGSTCTYSNDYYSQYVNVGCSCCQILIQHYRCLPGAAPPAPTSNPPSSPTSVPGPAPTGGAGSGLDGKFKAKGKKFWGSCADANTLNIAGPQVPSLKGGHVC